MKMVLCAFALGFAAAAARAEVVTEDVEYRHGDEVLEGYLAYDDSIEGTRPGVLIVHEWWGLTEHPKQRARRLAELGYTAFALDMYGKGVVTEDAGRASELAGQFYNNHELWRERAKAGLDVLREHDLANAAEIVAIGYCFGGSTVLELARAGADIDGVASFHGGLKTEMPAKKGDVEARVLVLHGADDPMVPMSDVEQFMEEMREAGADYQINMYGGAVHSFTNKRADSHGIEGVAYDKKADERSWEALKLFLKDSFNE